MDRGQLPLNALRAFEASARHLNFTRAAQELCVSQGAVSHQVAALERRLGLSLFRRLPRGLALTDEGLGLVPVLGDAFDRMSATLDRYAGGRMREVLNLGVVGAFATGWLLDRFDEFAIACPQVDLRLMTNNNRVDLAGEGLDMAIRYGDGAWHGMHAQPLASAPLTPLCAPAMAARMADPASLSQEVLLRSYRSDEWPRWFDVAGVACPPLRGPVFDNSVAMVAAACAGHGVALAPVTMFGRELAAERLVRPFELDVRLSSYWLTRLHSKPDSAAMAAFRTWITDCAGDDG
jgi:LysR family transcriptional regulator of beta-lactamase